MIAKTVILLLFGVIVAESSPLTCSSVQGCSTWDWVKCAGVVASCAADCSKGITSQECISCLGSSYDTCKDCFLLAKVIKDQETILERIQVTKANGCSRLDWMKCAGVAHSAECATECDDGLTSPACISFLGQSYVQCGSCLSTVEKIKAAESMFNASRSDFKNKTPTAHIEHCNALDYAACAGVVVGCAAVCSAAEIDAPACIACLGGSYSTCKNCF